MTVGPGNITCMMHPFAYKNKILIGFDNGGLQLWNVSTCQLIHTFKENVDFSSGTVSIQVLEQAPALHMVAVGYSNGRISLLNLQEDSVLREFQVIYF